MKQSKLGTTDRLLPKSRSMGVTLAATLAFTVFTPTISAEVQTDGAAHQHVVDTGVIAAMPSADSGNGQVMPKITVEADAESSMDLYDPTDTDNPYNKSYNVSNSATTTKTDTDHGNPCLNPGDSEKCAARPAGLSLARCHPKCQRRANLACLWRRL